MSAAEAPNGAQLRMLFLASALPFVGFGFLDNFLMILCGEAIDVNLCVIFNFSTMAAAAIGNTISDVAGIFSGGAVENLARHFGVEEPPMSSEQRLMRVTKVWQYTGQVLGIVTGCILGCCPLLWLDPHEAERLRKEKEKSEILQAVINKVLDIAQAEVVGMMFLDKEQGDLKVTHGSANMPKNRRWKLDAGFIGHVATTGQFVNIADLQEELLYDPEEHEDFLGTGVKVQSVLCMPIFQEGKVHGVLVAINKLGAAAFSTKDEDFLSAICSHVSVAVGDTRLEFETVIENCERAMNTSGAPEWSTSGSTQRMAKLYLPAMEGIRNVLNAEATALMLLNAREELLYTEVIDGPLPSHTTRVGEGIAGKAVELGKTLNVDARDMQSWFDEGRHTHYQGTDLQVRSELVVPLMDTSRKCLGAIKCINKEGSSYFSKKDVEFVTMAAEHIGMMLEGPDAGLRRVLALSRMRMQQHDVFIDGSENRCGVICTIERAHGLPVRAAGPKSKSKGIDPYVTLTLRRGNPLEGQKEGLHKRLWRARNSDRKARIRKFAKSNTILQDTSPQWNQTIAVAMPPKLDNVPVEELYLHVLLWDYDTLKEDELVAQAIFRLQDVQQGQVQPYPLLPIPGQEDDYDLENARIWVGFNLGDAVTKSPDAGP
ncbi:unnamed protein product [Prorocentrum cordatum]|uniref:C2 domain-containing protein n=1 Tax=Prorocentrum cordatum TaxID=2364126 RepID=A0ABN9WWZ1_9DINO|nr:unnamed protein product [Polarella glacialis]